MLADIKRHGSIYEGKKLYEKCVKIYKKYKLN